MAICATVKNLLVRAIASVAYTSPLIVNSKIHGLGGKVRREKRLEGGNARVEGREGTKN